MGLRATNRLEQLERTKRTDILFIGFVWLSVCYGFVFVTYLLSISTRVTPQYTSCHASFVTSDHVAFLRQIKNVVFCLSVPMLKIISERFDNQRKHETCSVFWCGRELEQTQPEHAKETTVERPGPRLK